MVDKFTQSERSRIMSRIKGRNTSPEKKVRSLIHKMGYRFRINVTKLPGNPDIVLPRHRKIIFVHGCFWHGHKGCSRSKRPTSNIEFWDKKISGNIKRDAKVKKELELSSWKVFVIWQCETKKSDNLKKRLEEIIGQSKGVA